MAKRWRTVHGYMCLAMPKKLRDMARCQSLEQLKRSTNRWIAKNITFPAARFVSSW